MYQYVHLLKIVIFCCHIIKLQNAIGFLLYFKLKTHLFKYILTQKTKVISGHVQKYKIGIIDEYS